MTTMDGTQEAWQKEALETDRSDLLGLLALRFDQVPVEVQSVIGQINQLDTLERLILVAANLANWEQFVEELKAGTAAFRIVGESYRPV